MHSDRTGATLTAMAGQGGRLSVVSRGWGLLLGAAVVVLLCGCGSQDEVIGNGPAALVFSNDGSSTIALKVSWQEDGGQWRAQKFSVYMDGRVELRLSDRDRYYVDMDADEDTTLLQAPTQTPTQTHTQVVTLDKGEPCAPPRAATQE